MTEFEQLWESGPVLSQAEHFKLGTDTVLLSSFVRLEGVRRGIDLGCASGALSLLLLSRSERLHMTGLEIVEQAVELAKINMAENSLTERSELICGDIRSYKALFKPGSFDLVVANPPYYPEGSGQRASGEARGNARGDSLCSMEQLCSASAYLCRTGGYVCFVHRAERMAELFCCMSERGIEPKRLRLVCNKWDSAPKLILVEGRRGGKRGLKTEPSLFLRNADGSETEELKKIYRR